VPTEVRLEVVIVDGKVVPVKDATGVVVGAVAIIVPYCVFSKFQSKIKQRVKLLYYKCQTLMNNSFIELPEHELVRYDGNTIKSSASLVGVIL
jgi:hypothetical protein